MILMGMVPENLEWLLAFIYGVAPGIVAWSVPGDFSLAWLRGFLPGVAPGIFAWSGFGHFCLEWFRGFSRGVAPGSAEGAPCADNICRRHVRLFYKLRYSSSMPRS